MDTTILLLLVCVVLIAITLILVIGFCCMLRVYLQRQPTVDVDRPDKDKYRPSYSLGTVYTNGAHENLGFPQETKDTEVEAKKIDGHKNEVIKT